MRSFIIWIALAAVASMVGCAASPCARSVTATGSPATQEENLVADVEDYTKSQDAGSATLVAERSPFDGLDIRLRVPPGWRVGTIAGNYIEFRSQRDTAFITVWDDDGSVQWGMTYYTSDGDDEQRCRLGYRGEANSSENRLADFQAYLDDTDEPVMIYLNWPDIDGVYAFGSALALREGGQCVRTSDPR